MKSTGFLVQMASVAQFTLRKSVKGTWLITFYK